MRRRDYRCTSCGCLFEYLDSIHDPVHEYLQCPICKQPAKRVIAAPIIGKISRGTFVTDFPSGRDASGRTTYTTMTRDEVERRLAKEPEKSFTEDYLEKTRKARYDKLDQLIAKDNAGELKPPPELTPQQREMVEKAVKAANE